MTCSGCYSSSADRRPLESGSAVCTDSFVPISRESRFDSDIVVPGIFIPFYRRTETRLGAARPLRIMSASYRIGLVGKPSVGKSSFFNAATMNDVPEGPTRSRPSIPAWARPTPASTVPHRSSTRSAPQRRLLYGRHAVRPDETRRRGRTDPRRTRGQRPGQPVLSDLNETDVLVHVVDFSGKTDAEGEATEGHDPRDDIAFLEEELDQWYLGVLEKGSLDTRRAIPQRTTPSRRNSPSR